MKNKYQWNIHAVKLDNGTTNLHTHGLEEFGLRKLDRLEKELTNLLSDDKQTELKIDELEKLLNL